MSNFDAFADFRMDGHVAIVTGGAQNIGEAIAKTFSGAGAKVIENLGLKPRRSRLALLLNMSIVYKIYARR